MKRFVCALLLLTLLAGLWGCSSRESPPEDGVRFYYPRAELAYGQEDGVMGWELREDDEGDLSALLARYLEGPAGPELRSLFPQGLTLVSALQEGETVDIVLSPSLDSLSGLDRTLACAGLTLTCLELTDARQVRIHTEEGALSGETPLVMDRDSLLLVDNGFPAPSQGN